MEPAENVLAGLLQRYPRLAPQREQILQAADLVVQCFEQGGLVLACGNGGSASDADHIVGELMKGFLSARPLPQKEKERFGQDEAGIRLRERLQGAIPAVSLVSHGALLSAFSNDVDPQLVYAQQVYGYGSRRKALVMALSTSGNSANVVNAVRAARALGLPSIAVTGETGGELARLCTVCLRMPSRDTYRSQEYTLPVYHAICAMAEARCFAAAGA